MFVVLLLTNTIAYQHDRLKEKIVERACKMFGEEKKKVLEEAVEGLMGPEIRSLCSLQDDDFYKELSSRLKF